MTLSAVPAPEISRWRVKQCRGCGFLWPSRLTVCKLPTCGRWLNNAETFDVVRVTLARASDPRTSRAAAFSHEPRLGSQRAAVLETFRRRGALTAREACDRSGIVDGWKRVSELVQGGHLEVVGERRDPVTRKQVQVFAVRAAARLFG